MASGPKQRVVVFILLAAMAAGALVVWGLRGRGSEQAKSGSLGQAGLGDRVVARRGANDALWELSFPATRPLVKPVRVTVGAILEEITRLHPDRVAGGPFPQRLEIRASGAVPMEDVMLLMRDVARAAETDLEIVLQVHERVQSLEMTFERWDGESARPAIQVTALQNKTSGEYVLVSDGVREARVLRYLVTERAIRAIARTLPDAMFDVDRVVRITDGSGAALRLADGATLLAALRQPERRLRVTGLVQGAPSPSQD